LDRLRAAAPTLEDFVLLNRGNRLSILPVSASQWRAVLKLEKPSA
jgi:predicted RNA-binding protein with PUA-like domain